MLEIYDRVLPSRSVPDAGGLVVLAGADFTSRRAFSNDPGRILARIGTSLDETLSGRVFETWCGCVIAGGRNEGLQPPARPRTSGLFLSMGPARSSICVAAGSIWRSAVPSMS